jgi:hypothetical protein
MNLRLVFQLSLFGLAMSVATVFVVPANLEPVLWLIIFIVCAWVLARRAPSKAPLHGLLVSMLNSLYITTAHIIFAETYIAGHADEAAAGAQFGLPVRTMMAITGPIIGVVSGLVLALFTFIATKFVKRAGPS